MNSAETLVVPKGESGAQIENLLAGISIGKRLLHYTRNQMIFAQGDEAAAVYYIQQGQVRVTVVSFAGKEATLSVMGPREFLGMECLSNQRQRIAIARAIIRNAPILILDEPTSGLDAASEQSVIEALEQLMHRTTCIVIAHRLATIQRADVIFVLEEEGIVEQGSHSELLRKGGLYSQLHEIQFNSLELGTAGTLVGHG